MLAKLETGTRNAVLSRQEAFCSSSPTPSQRWSNRRSGGQSVEFVFPRRYPYTLVYRHHDGLVSIVAVAHHKRHPEYWLQR
jgi:hypothetical protein